MKYIYSDSLGEMVVKQFTYKGEKYIWNDMDCVYYSEETEEHFFYEIPNSINK